MFSPFEQTVNNMFFTLMGASGIHATYRRGDQSCTLIVVPALSRFTVEDAQGFKTSLQVHDFLLATEDLGFSGQRTKPQAGDQIEIQRMDGVQVYRVMSPGPGEPDWKYSDTSQARLRLHTKFMESIA